MSNKITIKRMAGGEKKEYNTEPTNQQKKAFKNIIENQGKKGKGMKDAGYTKKSSQSPKRNLTESKGWQQLMDKYISDDDLAKKHKELLNKKETVLKNNNKTGKVDVIKTGEIDAQAVGKGLDMGYKLKGKYAPEKKELSGSVSLGSLFDDAKKDE